MKQLVSVLPLSSCHWVMRRNAILLVPPVVEVTGDDERRVEIEGTRIFVRPSRIQVFAEDYSI